MEFCFHLECQMMLSWYVIQTLLMWGKSRQNKHSMIHIYVSWSLHLLVLQEATRGCTLNHVRLFGWWSFYRNWSSRWTNQSGWWQTNISLVKNPVLHGISKHIDTNYHFLRNQIQNGVFEVVHCITHKQLVDVMTKTIKTEYFINLRNEIVVVDF